MPKPHPMSSLGALLAVIAVLFVESFVLGPSRAAAQVATATILGTVTDQSNAAGEQKVSSTSLEVERRFSDPIRLESGCESFGKGENRHGKNLSHDLQERHPGTGPLPDQEHAALQVRPELLECVAAIRPARPSSALMAAS